MITNTFAWEQRKLGEMASVHGGHTPSMAISENYSASGHLWITSQDVKTDYISNSTSKLSDRGLEKLNMYGEGTLVMVVRSGILRHTLPIAMLLRPAAINQDIKAIEPKENVDSLWLMNWLKSREKQFLKEHSKTGTTVESIDSGGFRSILIFTPSLSEQRRIGSFFRDLDDLITLHQRKEYCRPCSRKTVSESNRNKESAGGRCITHRSGALL